MPDPNFVNPGDPPKASDINDIVDEVRWLKNVRQGKGISIAKTATGWTISTLAEAKPFLAVIKTAGPDGEDDYDDHRYWVSNAYVDNTEDDDDTIAVSASEFDADSPFNVWVTATNFGEDESSHQLSDGDPVWVYIVLDQGSPPVYRYMFWDSPPLPIVSIHVNVSQSGGANGTQSSAATYTYNATDLSGNAIAGGPFSVAWARPLGAVNVATHRVGYYNADGDFVLVQVDETPQFSNCS